MRGGTSPFCAKKNARQLPGVFLWAGRSTWPEKNTEELIAHVRGRLAAFKRPRHVLFVDALPLTSNGKVAKDAVRQQARATL